MPSTPILSADVVRGMRAGCVDHFVPPCLTAGLGALTSALVISFDKSSQPFCSEHRRVLSRKRAIAADWARAAQRIDHSIEISGWTILRATTPGSAAAAVEGE